MGSGYVFGRTTGPHRCPGFPDDHECAVIIQDRAWCRDCTIRRQKAEVAGAQDLTPIGIVLADFKAPEPVCRCGGDPSYPDHIHSLAHLTWSWAQQQERGFTTSAG